MFTYVPESGKSQEIMKKHRIKLFEPIQNFLNESEYQ